MFRRVIAVFLLVSVLGTPASGSLGEPGPANATGGVTNGPSIEAVYPNPVAEDDVGEHVVLRFPRPTNLTGWTLTDDESTVSLGNGTGYGRIAVTADPAAVANLTDHPVAVSNDSLALANGGDEVRLLHRGRLVDETEYENAPDAELYRRDGGKWKWEPLGATDFEPTRTGPTTARTFVLPDAPGVPAEVIRSADRRILLAGYAFESERIARLLGRAADQGVEVRVLLDDAPAGGITTAQARVLDSLSRDGVEIEMLGGEYARYSFHHPKYAVVDDRALVMTENWKLSGTGGRSSRGWGVVVHSSTTADALAAVFCADADWRDTTAWSEFRRGRTFTDEEPADGDYPSRFEPRTVTAKTVTLLAAPDNAEPAIVRELDGAEESIDVVQASIGDRNLPFVRALLRAADRGVEVRVLLSSAWYSEEENEAMAAWLNRRAEAAALPLEARVADPGDRFEKIHAKGVIIDRETAVVGSLNWNDHSATENREVVLALEGEAVGAYYGRVFEADWNGGSTGGDGTNDLPVGLLAAVAGIAVLAWLVARRIEFVE